MTRERLKGALSSWEGRGGAVIKLMEIFDSGVSGRGKSLKRCVRQRNVCDT